MATMIGGIVAITLAVIVMAAVYMPQLKQTNTSTWTTQETSLWSVLGIFGIIGLGLGVLNVFGVV